MSRRILLPSELSARLDNMVLLREEVNGVLLYKQAGDDCSVDTVFMTGVGCEGHVQAHPERVEVINEFFTRRQDYRFVKFHTHSRGTIVAHGAYYAKNFSGGDISGIKEQLRQDKGFIAMLVTPETKILSGIDNPKLEIVSSLESYRGREREVQESLQAIARAKGYDISRFRARVVHP